MGRHDDIQLHLLDEANLVSACRHGIDLDLPALRSHALRSELDRGRHPGRTAPESARHELADRVGRLRSRLRAVIVHAWPRPNDPVVVALRQEAVEMALQMDKLQRRLLG